MPRPRPAKSVSVVYVARPAREYNGAGPMADAYAARVLADAHAYQGAGTISAAGIAHATS